MPRSFLVKKAERVRVDKTLCDDDEDDYGYRCRGTSTVQPVLTAMAPYTPTSLQPLAVRLANGKYHRVVIVPLYHEYPPPPTSISDSSKQQQQQQQQPG